MSQENEQKSGKKQSGAKVGAVIILIISAIVFIPVGGTAVVQSIFSKNKAPVFGSYNGKKIEYSAGSDFANAASNIAQSYQNQGYQINSQAEYYIFNQAFNQTLLSMAFSDAVSKSGYSVPAAAVNREMLPYFYDADGKFSQRIYNQADENTITTLRKSLTKQLTYNRYVSDLFGASETIGSSPLYGLKTSSKEAPFITAMGSEKHSFDLVSFNTADFPESEAAKWASDNSEKFTSYELSAITVDDESAAKAVLKQLNANEITFEDAVSEKSQKYYTDTDGKVTSSFRYQIEDMLADKEKISAIDSLSVESLSDVIETEQGYTIFKCVAAPKTADFTDKATISNVLSYMKANESGYIENYYSDIAKTFTAQAAISTFDKACEEYNVTKVSVPAFAVNYGNTAFYDATPSDVKELSSLSSNEAALKTAFSLKLNEVSEPVVLGSNVVVFKCTGIQNETAEADDTSYNYTITSYDQSSAQSTLMASDKVENNFMTTYFTYFLSNSNN